MNKDAGPFPKSEHYEEKVPWKLGRHVNPNHVKMLNKLMDDYRHQAVNDIKFNKRNHLK